jgi:hypothetical protein
MQVSTVYQRNNGAFYAVVVNEDGSKKYTSTGARNKDDALRKLPNLLLTKSVESAQPKPERQTSSVLIPTLVDCIASLSTICSDLSQNTIERQYKPYTQKFLDLNGNKPVSQYTVGDVQRFKQNLSGSKLQPVTVSMYFKTMKAFFNRMKKAGYVRSNPFNHSAQVKVPEPEPSTLTTVEVKTLLESV